MEKTNVGSLVDQAVTKLREMVDTNVMIGQTIRTDDGVTLIPVSNVSIGFASGGSDFQSKQAGKDGPFGGGAGAAVKVTPAAFIVVKDGNTRVLSLTGETKTMDKLIDAAPGLIDKVVEASDKLKKKDTADK